VSAVLAIPMPLKKRLGVLSYVPLLLITEQALNIAEALVRQGVIPPKAAEYAVCN